MITFFIRPVIFILAATLLMATPANAAKKHFLDGLTGSWKGKGFVTTSANAKEEAVRCRLRNKLETKKPKLKLNGTCGIGGVIIPMNGWIQQNGNSKKYTASLFKSLGFLRIDSFSGSLKGSKLNLKFTGKDKVNKEQISAFISIQVKSKTRFDIHLSNIDPKTKRRHNVGTIKFSAKK